MLTLLPPYRTPCRYSRRATDRFDGFPIPWAVPVEDVGSARVLIDCLRGAAVSAVEIVVGQDGRVYVRWTD